MYVASNELKELPNWPFLLLLLTSRSCSIDGLASAKGPIIGTFSTPGSVDYVGSHRLQHLVVDKYSALVYVGGVNWLYQLSPELDLQVTANTGPREDSFECPDVDCPDSVPKTQTDNANKALVIDYEYKRLIACGTLYQGSCSVRSLKNISKVLMEGGEPVVANTLTDSTVAFIADGPPNPQRTHVLYVGVTYTGNSRYRLRVPAVSSRSLATRNEMFQIAMTDVTTGTRISVFSRDRYPIHYVYGFSSEGFSYFLTRQMKELTNNSSFISKLVRVCQDDRDYYSYTEIPLECGVENGTQYNLVQAAYVDKPGSDMNLDDAAKMRVSVRDDVLYAVFAESDDGTSNRPTSHSALCVYPLKSIRQKFTQNIQKCFNGEGDRGLDFISPSRPCVYTKLHQKIGEDFCGLDVNTPLGGKIPVIEQPVYTWNNVLLSSVAATTVANLTVVFLGTSKGHLKKMVVESGKGDAEGQGAYEYDDITVDKGSRVSSDMVFDPQRMHLYVMTERKVTKVRVQDCDVYETCGECFGSQDPYCGWCSMENKCSLKIDCRDAVKEPFYWISYKRGRCPTFTSVEPNQIQRTTTRTLSLAIGNLPTIWGQLQCAFSALGKTLLTNATRTAEGVNCSTPHPNKIPTNPSGQHHFTAKLSVRITPGPDVVDTNFTFFDCRAMADHCGLCLALADKYQCGWCQASDKCEVMDQCDQSKTGGSEHSVATENAWLDRDRICPNLEVKSFYPKFGPLEGGTNVTIEGVNLGKTFSDIEDITVAGTKCRPYEELYVQSRQIVCLLESLGTNESRRGPAIVRVSYFKGKSADDYEFVDPIIKSIHPTWGPLSGGTLLTIRGEFMNAGSSIQVAIDPAMNPVLPCDITYTNITHAICRTRASNYPFSGKLHMSFDRVRRYSRQMYEYVEDPTIEYAESGVASQFKVPKGIPAGGIIISVVGENFKYIQEPKICVRYYGVEHVSSCQVLSNQRMECRSPPVPVFGRKILPNSPLLLDYGFLMDDVRTVRNLSHSPRYYKFELYPDPVYEKFDEEIKYHYNGDYLTVNGLNLDQVCQKNDVEVTIGTGSCNVTSLSSNQLTCRPPAIQPPAAGSNPNDYPQVVVIVGGNLRYFIGKLSYESQHPIYLSIVIGVSMVSFVILVLVLMAVFLVYRRKSKRISQALRRMQIDDTAVFFDNMENNVFSEENKTRRGLFKGFHSQLSVKQTELLPYDTRWEFPRNRLRLGTELGIGCFGRVVKAEAIGIRNAKETVQTVAVKMVRSHANVADLEALISELRILIYLGSHLNVLNLLGACTTRISKGELLVIVEYCPFGNLQSYLLNHRNNFVNRVDELGNVATDNDTEGSVNLISQPKETTISLLQEIDGYLVPNYSEIGELNGKQSKPEFLPLLNDVTLTRDPREPDSFWKYEQDPNIVSNPPALSTKDLISWSFQVARGMDYLASKKVLHGDLAARNVLLAENGVVKVADFGMARKIYYESKSNKKGQGPMPIKWMAIEIYTDRIFSSQSDVWSFGILLWELFSLGQTPYPDMDSKKVIKELLNGYRMETPLYAPRVFGEIMKSCWKTDSKERPTFGELELIISGQMEFSVSSYYLQLNAHYEKLNKEKESTPPTDRFGLAKLLDVQGRLTKTKPHRNGLDGSDQDTGTIVGSFSQIKRCTL